MTDPSPRRLDESGAPVRFEFEGREIVAREGDSVALALAASGIRHLRDSVVSGDPRGMYCMMGTCFDCLVEIDGQPNRQACMTPVSEGLNVRIQRGAPVVGESA
ncbi:(2Fe-2S)-binding protein [Palleronia sp. LCG004]|uniref:(2Fe-2S)-binding protein n=1 Tax=Palleronia sp. LCG004 TaxID=3079304 RepID=UPI00294383FD|nr:(2Fe-2S)-binding protein [Palleronia sp. LCG004]WOI58246.1 (2Fe-2S)-binding protein [Palleronia sp. LCG004]